MCRKDTFKALQNVKKQVENALENDNLGTPKNSSIGTKKGVLQTPFKNGASDGN